MKKETWKPVTISGFTGILMGAASSYGVQKLMANEASTDNLSDAVKTTVANDDLCFKEAFEAARAEVGPGGVFTWRGNLYNTYTAEEWNAKTHQEQQQFAEEVTPQTDIAEEVQVVASAETSSVDGEDVQLANIPSEDNTIVDNQTSENLSTANEEVANNDSENDVRVVGFGDVELDNGRVITVEELDVNGQRVAVIDLDKDGTPDVAMSDLNHNNQADEGEVIDLHTGEALSFTNDTVETNDDLPVFDA